MAGATSPLPSHPLASGRRSAEHLQNPPHSSPATPASAGAAWSVPALHLGVLWALWGPSLSRWARGLGPGRPAEGSVRPPLGRREGEGAAARLPAVWSQSGKQSRNCGLSPFPQALHRARDQMTQSGLIILIAYS